MKFRKPFLSVVESQHFFFGLLLSCAFKYAFKQTTFNPFVDLTERFMQGSRDHKDAFVLCLSDDIKFSHVMLRARFENNKNRKAH